MLAVRIYAGELDMLKGVWHIFRHILERVVYLRIAAVDEVEAPLPGSRCHAHDLLARLSRRRLLFLARKPLLLYLLLGLIPMYPQLLGGDLAARVYAPHRFYWRLCGLGAPVTHDFAELEAQINIAPKVNIAGDRVLNVRNAMNSVMARLCPQLAKPPRQILPAVGRDDCGGIVNNHIAVMEPVLYLHGLAALLLKLVFPALLARAELELLDAFPIKKAAVEVFCLDRGVELLV